jgi:hypothetical protein
MSPSFEMLFIKNDLQYRRVEPFSMENKCHCILIFFYGSGGERGISLLIELLFFFFFKITGRLAQVCIMPLEIMRFFFSNSAHVLVRCLLGVFFKIIIHFNALWSITNFPSRPRYRPQFKPNVY